MLHLVAFALLLLLLAVAVPFRRILASGWLAQHDRRRSSQTIARIRKSGWVAFFAVGG
ncbi:hypothetical protein J2847_004124 [Azospirillum agricola]|uniref:hypothetical protein n=1 Tax=Azospirillum agricola TaxID=1720247 RepID=UPI001AE705B5|nr:hypothetical protein [Azospirillum agricola]MBP2230815.1 hypothetical protein [Azospirillum agricola]